MIDPRAAPVGKFRRILVPLDGSVIAETVLPWVTDYARQAKSEVHLVHVVAPEDRMRLRATTKTGAQLQRYLDRLCGRLEDQDIRARRHLIYGEPIERLLEAEKALKASLIALSARGKGRFTRVLMGATAEKILRRASRPLLLIGRDVIHQAGVVRRIIVPLDGSELSESVVPTALHLAVHYQAAVTIVTVRRGKGRKADARLFKVSQHLQKHAVNARVVFHKGDPATRIAGEARGERSLLVMNSHGRSGFQRFMLGSVAEEVARGAPVPVLVTRTQRVEPVYSEWRSRPLPSYLKR